MVAERAVAMRLDRWGREHGVFPEDAGEGFPSAALSITSSSGDEADDDSGAGGSSSSYPSEGEGDSGSEGREARAGGRRRGRRKDREFARVSVGAGEMAADVEHTDEFRLRLLEAVLGLYSNHPLNYHELETKFHALSFFLCALPYYENRDLKGLALKTLEVICVSFKVRIQGWLCCRRPRALAHIGSIFYSPDENVCVVVVALVRFSFQ